LSFTWASRARYDAAMARLSIVMPVLEEGAGIAAALAALAAMRGRGVEVIVADGGSLDDTVAKARPQISSSRRRAGAPPR
jgi:glycosyltransferase involved in cell wall biosynthesis